jgi:hypothetical protein
MRKITFIHWRLYFELISKLYSYPLISPFDIFCQQEVNRINNKVGKAQQVTFEKGTRKM